MSSRPLASAGPAIEHIVKRALLERSAMILYICVSSLLVRRVYGKCDLAPSGGLV